MAKYKATGCARFFMFLIVFLPIAYFGAQYLMNTGKIDGIREKIEQVTGDKNTTTTSSPTQTTGTYDNAKVQKQLKELITKIKEQEKTIAAQNRTIEEQKGIIQRLQNMRSSQQSTTNAPQQKKPTTQNDRQQGTSLEELLKEAEKVMNKN